MSKVGVCEFCLPVWGPDSVVFAADCGFEGLQITDLRGAYRGFPLTNRRIQEGYLEAATRTGVEVGSLHLMALSHSTGMIYPENDPRNEMARHSLLKGIESCLALGIQSLNLSGGDKTAMDPVIDREIWGNLIAFLNFTVRSCADHGIVVAYETSMELVRLREFLESIPGLTVNYDIYNSVISGTGFQIPLNVPEKVDHVHIKDGIWDSVTRTTKPVITGTGTGNISEAVRILKEKAYDGWYYSESKYCQYMLPEDIKLGRRSVAPFKELSIEDEIPPSTFGSTDMTEVIRRDCEAIRKMVC